jgi:hypothetical protein
LSDPSPVDIGWWGDASSSFGIGVVVQGHWAIWCWAPGFKVGPKRDFDIGWAEAAALELGLRLALQLGIIPAGTAQNTVYLVRSDNAGIVAVANKSRSRSAQTNAILKHVYHLQAGNGIRLHTTFVPTRTNIADALSRGDVSSFLAGFPNAIASAPIPLPPHLADKLVRSL